jgi:tRNA nucleotidyltransferase (CCA-adding enzyme)
VRDLLLGQEVLDYDLAVQGDGFELGRRVARRLRAAFVPLDETRGMSRVVHKPVQIDFASLTGDSIEADLSHRDLTINAMAMEVGGQGRLIDPTGGQEDLRTGWVRVPAAEVLDDDPLRILRVFRFAGKYRYRIQEETLWAAASRGALLRAVSPERVRVELFKILGCDPAVPLLSEMAAIGVLGIVLEPFGGLAVDGLERAWRLEGRAFSPGLRSWLVENQGEERTRRSLLKLLALSAQPHGQGASALRLSAREVRSVERLAHVGPLSTDDWESWFPLFEACQNDSPGAALLAGFDDPCVEDLFARWQAWMAAGKSPLLKGQDIMALTGLKPGPAVGQLTMLLRREHAAGRVTSPEAAADFLKRQL